MPVIDGEVHGVVDARHAQGQRLDGSLRYRRTVDVDVRLSAPGTATGDHPFRIVKVEVPRCDRHGKPNGQFVACWYVTSLPRAEWSPAMIALLYLLRGAIERIWRQAKSLARMDQLRSKRPVVVFLFLMSSLLLWAIALDAYLRRRIQVFMREGHHPNPGQPRRAKGVFEKILDEAKYLPRAA